MYRYKNDLKLVLNQFLRSFKNWVVLYYGVRQTTGFLQKEIMYWVTRTKSLASYGTFIKQGRQRIQKNKEGFKSK